MFQTGEPSSLEEQITWHVVTDSSYSSLAEYRADRSPDPHSKMTIYMAQNDVFPPSKGSLCGPELKKSALIDIFCGQYLAGQSQPSILCLSGERINHLIPACIELSCQPFSVCYNKLRASKLWLLLRVQQQRGEKGEKHSAL